MATFYDQWLNGEPHTKNMGSFHTSLMESHKLASEGNRMKLQVSFPGYFTEREIEGTITIGEMMKALEITAEYDTAKPQKWMDEMEQCGFDRKDLYSNYVWLYDEKAKIFGRPFNFRAAYADYLMAIIH